MREEKKDMKIPEKFKDLLEKIEKLSVLDLAELVKVLEERFGVIAQAPITMVTPTSKEEKTTEEQTVFNVELTELGANKIAVIKVVREITQKGLKESKDLVEGAPKIVKEGVGKEEGETIKKKLEEAGAKASLK